MVSSLYGNQKTKQKTIDVDFIIIPDLIITTLDVRTSVLYIHTQYNHQVNWIDFFDFGQDLK